MAALVLEPSVLEDLIRRRRETGADRFDEVWDGVYIVSPNPNNEHQGLANALASIFSYLIYWPGLGQVFQGANISDQEKGWESNYRIPDVAVFLNGNPAQNRQTHWLGGPDFAVEILSRNDRAREKRPFYAKVGTRELLVIDRDPWALELYRLENGQLLLSEKATVENPVILTSSVLPLSFTLSGEPASSHIEVAHADSRQRWSIQCGQ